MVAIAAIYGSLAGLVVIVTSIVIFLLNPTRHLAGSEWIGYLVMILAFTLIFVGVKRYRDRDLGGVIKFLPAFGLGLLMALVASLIYVVVWEIYLVFTGDGFITAYAASVIEGLRMAGATPEEIAAKEVEMAAAVEAYANPLFRLPLTFAEIFPVGFIVALISALVLRNPRILPARTASEGTA